MTNTLYADIDALQAEVKQLTEYREAYREKKLMLENDLATAWETIKALGAINRMQERVIFTQWQLKTELQARIAELEKENETLHRDNEFLAGVVGYELGRVRP